ncbi:hypothetical protein PXK47_20410 [Phaeobacter gallaeciensis]|nr:hypothetical protein [Phaeobacter gallaeciensis]
MPEKIFSGFPLFYIGIGVSFFSIKDKTLPQLGRQGLLLVCPTTRNASLNLAPLFPHQ